MSAAGISISHSVDPDKLGTSHASRASLCCGSLKGTHLNTRDIISWLSACPVLEGETLNLDYLPSHEGWSLSTVRETVKTDILGTSRALREIRVTRRTSVADNAERLAVLEQLEGLAAWAREHPPDSLAASGPDIVSPSGPEADARPSPGFRIRAVGLPQFSSRNASGTEDLSVTLTLME